MRDDQKRLPWLAVLLLMAGLHGPARASQIDCFVSCRSGACEVHTAQGQRSVKPGRVERIDACGQSRMAGAGQELEGRFRSARGTERFLVREADKPFADLVPALTRGLCTSSPACMESRDRARVAAVAGKGIGVDAARRVGAPCETGLPCGLVLRPDGPMSIALQTGSQAGALRLVNAESGTTRTIAVRDSRVELPAGALAAGVAYAYSLLDAAGQELAAGHFTVMSARMQADVDADLAALRAKDPSLGSLEAIEILLDNQLDWDAQQRSR
jgi:hypothetical protein